MPRVTKRRRFTSVVTGKQLSDSADINNEKEQIYKFPDVVDINQPDEDEMAVEPTASADAEDYQMTKKEKRLMKKVEFLSSIFHFLII